MHKPFLLLILFGVFATLMACGEGGPLAGGGDSPTAAYKKLYEAVKSKDTDAIKAQMTKKTQEFAEMVSQRNNSPIEKVFENGFTATTFAEKLPEIRDERVNGDMGAVEVFNAKDNRWEDLPFIKEDGTWKLAIGEMWAGTFKSPGKGRAIKEMEAANAMGNNMIEIPAPNINGNGNIKPITPVLRPEKPSANAQ